MFRKSFNNSITRGIIILTLCLQPIDAKIVFMSDRDGNNEIYSMDSDGSNQVNLTNNGNSDYYPSLSSDGSKILFNSNRDGDEEIYVMDADGSNVIQLTNNTFGDQGAVYSPDDSKISYFNYQHGRTEVFIMDADGSNQTRLTGVSGYEGWCYGAVWSPDGTQLAYRSDNGGNSNIWLMDAADGANKVNLTNTSIAWEENPSWSPDGTQLIFHSKTSSSATFWNVWKIDLDGSNLVNLSNNSGFSEAFPSWSPDGTQIAYSSNLNGDNQVFVMDSDGSNQTNITTNSDYDDFRPWWGSDIVEAVPLLHLSPLSITYGVNLIGGFSTQTAIIMNAGSADLNITSIAISGTDPTNFGVDESTFSLSPGDSAILYVEFMPDDLGEFTAQLDVESDGGNGSVSLSGNGVAASDQNRQLAFDGSEDFCSINDGLQIFSELDTFTVELWVKLDHPGLGFGHLMGGANDNLFYFLVTSQGSPQFRTGAGSNLVAGDFGSVSTTVSEWVHLAFVKSGTAAGDAKVYVNGIDQTLSMFNDPGTTPVLTGQLDFGRHNSTSEFAGMMDEIRIWNIARSQIDILDNYQSELVGDESGFIGYWKFNKESGQRAFDSQTNVSVHNATLGADDTMASDDPTRIIDPPFGPAVFDISTDLIDFGNTYLEQSAIQELIIYNEGLSDLEVSTINIGGVDSNSFNVETTGFSLSPGDSAFLEIEFTPDSAVAYQALLHIESDAGSASINLVGAGEYPPIGVLTLLTDHVDMGQLLITESASDYISLTNTGTADLQVLSIHSSGDDSSSFEVDTASFAIIPADTIMLEVTFLADSAGDFSTNLNVESNGGNVIVPLMASVIDPTPRLTSIQDVPYDQGGWVELQWDASGLDAMGGITNYGVWEFVSDSGWVSLGDVPALEVQTYYFTAHTLGDSSDSGISWTEFMVTAHTNDPEVYYESEMLQGYSVDNLAPAIPTGFVFEISSENHLDFAWDEPVDEDFQYFRLYRSLEENFDLIVLDPFAELNATGFTDSLIDDDVNYYYQLTAVDAHGNESESSEELSAMIVSIDPHAIPEVFALHQNYPNPFNPVTILNYDLPQQSWVQLVVYDLNGREIKTLVDEIQDPGYKTTFWNGIGNHGKTVGSGIYVYRLHTDQFSRTRKMILLK